MSHTNTFDPAACVDHAGDRISKRLNFFEEPPPEIGDILSAISTLPKGKHPWSPKVKLAALVWSLIIGTGLGVGLIFLAGVHSWVWRLVWPGVGFLLGLAVGT